METRGSVISLEWLHLLEEVLEVKKPQLQEIVLRWVESNHPLYPWRQAGTAPYQVLIGEFLFHNCPRHVLIDTYLDFIHLFPSLQRLATLRKNSLLFAFRRIDFKERAHLINSLEKMAKALLLLDNEQIPRHSLSLYRATGLEWCHIQVVLCFGYLAPLAVCDSDVNRMLFRIFNRNLPDRTTGDLLQALGEALLSGKDPQSYNRGFLEIAETLCLDDSPSCVKCPLSSICDWAGTPVHRTVILKVPLEGPSHTGNSN